MTQDSCYYQGLKALCAKQQIGLKHTSLLHIEHALQCDE